MRERDIERYLVKRVKELGGEVRKVKWVGRRSAPDRVVFAMPFHFRFIGVQCVWVELKPPGGAKTFPKNAHERAQLREHNRMRKLGQHVCVIDSYECVDDLFAE